MFRNPQTTIPRWDQCCNPDGIQNEQPCTLIQQNNEKYTQEINDTPAVTGASVILLYKVMAIQRLVRKLYVI